MEVEIILDFNVLCGKMIRKKCEWMMIRKNEIENRVVSWGFVFYV